MSIIIKTPQPDTEERLVLVPPESVSRSVEGVSQPGACDLAVHTPHARDATHADLERAGYVTREMLAEQVRIVWAAGQTAEPVAVAMLRKLKERAEKAERERDEAQARAKAACELIDEVRAERDTLRAELARLTAPGGGSEGEPGFEHLRDCWDMAPRADASGSDVFRNGFFALYRLGVAHERARQQPAKDRATDEELLLMANDAYFFRVDAPATIDDMRGLALAVAARVRQERCLVAQAVGIPLLDSVSVGAVMGGGIRVRIVRRVDSLANTLGETKDVFCERANVPATLARLLGEVSR